MQAIEKVKLPIALVVAAFLAAAGYISFLILDRQDTLRLFSRYNVSWLVGQAATEFSRLEQYLALYMVPNGNVAEEEVALRFDIVFNRVELLKGGGDVRSFIESDPEHMALVAELEQVITEADALLPNLGEPGIAEKILDLVSPMDLKVVRLAAAANRWVGDQVALDRVEIIRLHWAFTIVSAALVLCGLILMMVLLWQNRLLHRAHAELQGTTSDLKATSAELAEANQTVQETNAELATQNMRLRQRDFELQTQNERFNTALNNMSQGLCMVGPDQRLIVCNHRYLEILGLDEKAVIPGTPIGEVLADQPELADGSLLVARGQPSSYVHDLPEGRTIAVFHQPMTNGGWVATYEDITERRQAEARIAHMAHHDALTELPNRVLFHEQMQRCFARQRRHGDQFAILCLDLDRFKSVNDTLGHPVGDALLRVVAERLLSCVRETDLVARLGGDEFAILQVGAVQPEGAHELGQRVLNAIAAPYEILEHKVVVSASIGIATAPVHGSAADELLRNADMALYQAKSDGRNIHRFFEKEMDIRLRERRALEVDLREAIAAEQLENFYQPLVDLKTGRIIGCEALLRWRHPLLGIIAPSDFIPIAEEVGLIVPLGERVLRRACAEAAKWPADAKVAVNLSPVQFKDDGLVHCIVAALEAAGLKPERLELEVTESVLLQDDSATIETLHKLHKLGVGIALDDFGTGYSSLSYLRRFPFDKIKIDRSFVSDIVTRSESLSIVQSITNLGNSLGMGTTGEGVETWQQMELLREAGCSEAQGYLFGKPQPGESILKLLHSRSSTWGEAA